MVARQRFSASRMLRSTAGEPASAKATVNGAASVKISTAGSAPLFWLVTDTSNARPMTGGLSLRADCGASQARLAARISSSW